MNWLSVIILSIVQGLTEFLPISSSGHLVIVPKILGFPEPSVLFDIMLHAGTLLSVLFYFRKELLQIAKGVLKREKESTHIFWLVFAGTLPAVIFGALFDKRIEAVFSSPKAVGLFFLVTAMFLFSTKFVKNQTKKFNQLNWKNALIVGLFQAVSILPGVSRSGSTMTGSLWQKADRETTFRFSFYLAIPAIFGALVFKSKELLHVPLYNLEQNFVGLIIAGIVGYFALILVRKVLESSKLWWFGFYCLILGMLVLLFVS